MSAQPDLFGEERPGWPEGFDYAPELITAAEEAALAARIAALPFAPYRFRGYDANRRVVSFGWRYEIGEILSHAGDLPGFLVPLRDRAAAFAGLDPEAVAHVLINEYAPGAGIGWHRDRPQFGEVIGVSLLEPCSLRLRRRTERGIERTAVALAPRSVYRLSGPARSLWEHSIAPMERLRYSVTFRTLAAP